MTMKTSLKTLHSPEKSVRLVDTPGCESGPFPSPPAISGTRQFSEETKRTAWYVIPGGYSWDNAWELARDLIVEVQTSEQETIALTRLSLGEYGIGCNLKEAVQDLLLSLSDYHDALESREGHLADSAKDELNSIRRILRRSTTT